MQAALVRAAEARRAVLAAADVVREAAAAHRKATVELAAATHALAAHRETHAKEVGMLAQLRSLVNPSPNPNPNPSPNLNPNPKPKPKPKPKPNPNPNQALERGSREEAETADHAAEYEELRVGLRCPRARVGETVARVADAVADGHKAAKEARTIAAAARVHLAKELLDTQASFSILCTKYCRHNTATTYTEILP